MHVSFFFRRHVVQINVRHKVDVNSASGNVGGDQNRRTLAFEFFQNSLTLILTLVRVNGFRLKSGSNQVANDSVRTMLRAAENNRSRWIVLRQQFNQQTSLLLLRNKANTLFNKLSRLLLRNNRNADRVVQNRIREVSNLWLHRCRKHQSLPLAWHVLKNSANGRKETHVQHAVGFVQHKGLQTLQMNIALLDEVHQATGSCYDNVNALSQSTDLWLLSHATINCGHTNGGKCSVVRETFMDLYRQFSRACKNEYSDLTRTGFG